MSRSHPPDESKSIVLDLQNEFKNIVLIEQENAGVCAARNNGINKSNGEWIIFVDQDDYLISNSLNTITKCLENAISNDLVLFPSCFENSDGSLSEPKIPITKEILFDHLEGVEFYHKYRQFGSLVTGLDAPWGICYRRDFINKNNLRFVEGVIYLDDAEFLGRVFCLAKNCSFFSYPFYVHKANLNSVSNSSIINSLQAINGFVRAAVNLKEFRNDPKLSSQQKLFINQPLLKLSMVNVQSCVSKKGIDFKKFLYVRNILKENNLVQLDLRGCNLEHTLYGKIYNKSFWLFLFYWFFKMVRISIKNKLKG